MTGTEEGNPTLEAIQKFARLAGGSVGGEITEITVTPVLGEAGIRIECFTGSTRAGVVTVVIDVGGKAEAGYLGTYELPEEAAEAGRKLAEVTIRRASQYASFRLELRKYRAERPDDTPGWLIWYTKTVGTICGPGCVDVFDGFIAILAEEPATDQKHAEAA